jgi:hypothetical protein
LGGNNNETQAAFPGLFWTVVFLFRLSPACGNNLTDTVENSVRANGVKNLVKASDSLIWIAPTNNMAHLKKTKFYANSN